MKTWLKGGLIGIAVWTFLYVLMGIGNNIPMDCSNVSLGKSCTANPLTMVLRYPFMVITFLQFSVLGCKGEPFGCIFAFPLSLIELAIIGAVIGFIIGKIKSRRKT